MITAVTLLACAVSGLMIWRTTPLYTASVTLYISDPSQASNPSEAYQGALLSQQNVQSYADIINQTMLTNAVINELGLDLTATQLSAEISAHVVPQTSLLTATVTNTSPRLAQQIANAVGAQFGKFIGRLGSSPGDRADVASATIVAPAVEPSAPSSPQPVRDIGIAVVAGLLAGMALAAARRSLDTTIKSAEQLTDLTDDAPSLGTVPFDNASRKVPIAARGAGGPRLEAYRKIRTNLHFIDVDQPRKVLMFTSAHPEEGKSSAVCNLAVLLADSGVRVIVVECDLHRPRAATYLGLPDAAGISDVLAGRCGLDDAVQQWGDNLFAVLASGTLPPNPSVLLGSRRMADLMETLRARYEIVLVDAPPVLPFADAAVTATACDGAILVIRHGKTKTEQVRRVAADLAAVKVPVFGTVLNMAPRGTQPDYGYSYRAKEPRPAGLTSVAGR